MFERLFKQQKLVYLYNSRDQGEWWKGMWNEMSPRRRTFHVDWDSPSDETGTVKRRPASFSVSQSIFKSDVRNCMENVQYYEVRDCMNGGFGLRLLKSIGLNDEIVEKESIDVSDSGSASASSPRYKEELAIQNIPVKGNRSPSSFRTSLQSYPFGYGGDQGETLSEPEPKEEISVSIAAVDDLPSKSLGVQTVKATSRKDFGLKLTQKPFKFPTNSKSTRTVRKLRSPLIEAKKFRTTKLKKSSSSNFLLGRGLVNSSSESSGIGSPLSPLSPCNQDAANVNPMTSGGSGRNIKTSDSSSSGLGSPDSPISPDSQQYSAAHLIQDELEKLHNCSCETRQAQVQWRSNNFHAITIRFKSNDLWF